MTDAKPQTTKKKPYVGTYQQYIERIVVRIMQESMSARDKARGNLRNPVEGFLSEREWNRIKKTGTNEFMKAAKERP